MSAKVRVELPMHLRRLAGSAGRDVVVDVAGPVTQRTVLDALEAAYPQLEGTVRDHTTKVRRPFIRFFACGEDLSQMGMDEELSEGVKTGAEAFLVIGAIAGG